MLLNGSIFNIMVWNIGSNIDFVIRVKMVSSKNSWLCFCFGVVINGDMILWKMLFVVLFFF